MSENQVMEVVKVRFTGNHPANDKMITRTFYVKPGTAEAQLVSSPRLSKSWVWNQL